MMRGMANYVSTGWTAGETVTAEVLSKTPGAEIGALVDAKVADASGIVTFTTLAGDTAYIATGQTSGRRVRLYQGSPSAKANALTGEISPADRGLLAWTIDPGVARDSNAPTNGLIRGSRIKHPGGLITGIAYVSLSPQVGGVAGQNFLGIYDTNGNRLAQTADLTAAWAAANAVEVTSPLSAPINLPAGFYDIVVLANMNAGINPGLVCWAGAAFVPNFGAAVNGAPFRGFIADAGAVALPAVLGAKTRRDSLDLFGLY